MYTVVLVLALASLMAVVALVRQPRAWVTVAFVVVNWLMVGYHYYSLLLVGAEGLFFILAAFHGRVSPRRWLLWLGLCVLSMIPITLWMAFAPGFRETFTIITAGIGGTGGPTPAGFFDDLWRDLSFGIIRWRPEQAILGYLLLPLMALGLGALLWRERGSAATRWSWLVALAALAPLLISVALFRSLAARYILFIVPALYVFAAAGIVALWRWHPALGVAGAMLPLVVAAAGLSYYFGPYHKSEYREMAAYLRAHREPADAVMLLAPRQHLLAKYYLPADWSFYTAPQIDLPPYWPLTAPRVVPEEMDGQIQDYLRQHPVLWLVLTSQNEVDPGEFVPKYLTAVAYKEDCDKWLDVDLCHFASPHAVKPYAENTPDVLFNGELRLARAALSRVDDPVRGRNYLLAELDWLAERKPTVDYRVTLRLLDGAGNVVAQRDEFPIGTLLPPTTWNAGDAKPGYMALPLGADTAPGTYQVVAGVYAPGDGALFGELVPLGSLEIR